MFVIPDLGGGCALGEEQKIGTDASVGIEDAIGQADDGVEVALAEQGLLDPRFDAFAEKGAIGQDQSGPAAGLEDSHQQYQEEIGGLPGAVLGRKIALNAVLLHAAEGGIGDNHIHPFLAFPVKQRPAKGVVVADVGGHVNAVQQQVGHAQDIRQVLLLDPGKAVLDGTFVSLGFRLFTQVLDGADQEAAGTAGRVEDALAKLGVDLFDDELGDGARSVELARIACGLKIFQQLFVDVAEHVTVVGGVEVDGVDLVDHLPHQGAILHVVVGILKGGTDEPGNPVAAGGQILELEQQGVVDESEQPIAGDAFIIRGPGRPAQFLGERGFIAVAQEFELLFAVVEDLEKEHPAQLFKALGIAVGAGVLAHDILDGFDEVGDVGHGSDYFHIEFSFQFVESGEVRGFAAKEIDDFDGRAEAGQRIDLENVHGLKALEARIRILFQEGVKDGSGFVAVAGKDITPADLVDPLPAGERRLVKGHMADEIKGVIVVADLMSQLIEKEALAGKFFDNRLLAFRLLPGGEEITQGGVGLAHGLAGVVLE